MTVCITAGPNSRGVYQYFVDGAPTDVVAESPITARSDSNYIADCCAWFIEPRYNVKCGVVTHDKDTVFVECE